MPDHAQNSAAQSKSALHIPELDGLRGIAALLVVLFHFSIVLTSAPGPLRLLRTLCTPGWTGVDLFFILSGCLITGILLDEKGTDGYFRRFYIRRCLRIFPVYYLALAVCFTIGRPWLLPASGVPFSTTLAYLFNYSNWLSLGHAEINSLNHYWSLAVEEQFYLCWPLAILLLNRKALPRLLIGVTLLAPVIRYAILSAASDPESAKRIAYVLTPARADGLAFGALVAIILRNQRLRSRIVRGSAAAICAFVALLLAWFGLKAKLHLESAGTLSVLYTFLSLVYSLIVLRVADGTGTAALGPRILRSKILRSAGRYSYAAYVFHFPLLIATKPLFDVLSPGARQIFALPYFIAGVALTFLLARISWSLLESPILKYKDILAPPPRTKPVEIAVGAS